MIKETIGECTLYLGDCNDVIADIGEIDCVLTDPPYKMEIHGRGFASKRDYYKKLDYGTTTDFEMSKEFLNCLLDKLSEMNMFFFCNKLMMLDLMNFAINSGMTFDQVVLCKSSPAPLTNNQWLPDKEMGVHMFSKCSVKGDYNTKRTWFVGDNYRQKDYDHPSVKPLYIVEQILRNISNPGAVVLDCFMGSGTTGEACVRNGRKFIGIERDEKYFDMSCKRIESAYSSPDMFMIAEKLQQEEMEI